MLIDTNTLKYKFGVNPKGILHVGAHLGEELGMYLNAGWLCPIIWVEGQANLAARLTSCLPSNHKVINAFVWDLDGINLNFKVTNNSQSSSLLNLGTHKHNYPDIFVNKVEVVQTKRLDSLIESSDNIDLLVLDIQGAELKALIGLGDHLKRVNYVYSEVNKWGVYEDCALVKELDQYLGHFGFKRVATSWVRGAGWGDALWIRSNLFNKYWTNRVLFELNELKKLIFLKNKLRHFKGFIKLKLYK